MPTGTGAEPMPTEGTDDSPSKKSSRDVAPWQFNVRFADGTTRLFVTKQPPKDFFEDVRIGTIAGWVSPGPQVGDWRNERLWGKKTYIPMTNVYEIWIS